MCNREILWSCLGEGFLRFIGSRCTKKEKVPIEKNIKRCMCTIVLKKDYKIDIAHGLFCMSIKFVYKSCCNKNQEVKIEQ